MKDFIKCTFGGLKMSYLFRQYIFGALIFAFLYYVATSNNRTLDIATIAFFTINTLLYPYARFVYENVVDFIVGDNVFFVSAIFMMITKCITMLICWWAAVFVAPLGLAYIYYQQVRTQS